MTPPPPPEGVVAVALDGAVYLRWDPESLEVTGARFFRVYLEGDEGDVFLLGDTDSPGFLDLRVENGFTFRYFVTSVDAYGHEGEGSVLASATPRPDFHDEVLYAFEDRPEDAGFRFQPSEVDDPIRHGDAPDRHFRVEADEAGWWLVPGPDVAVYPDAFFTTALRCGPAADASCSELSQAPASGYAAQDLELVPGFTYVLRLPDEGGGFRYAALRVSHVGYAQDERIVIFDWAHQLQPDNRQLAPAGP